MSKNGITLTDLSRWFLFKLTNEMSLFISPTHFLLIFLFNFLSIKSTNLQLFRTLKIKREKKLFSNDLGSFNFSHIVISRQVNLPSISPQRVQGVKWESGVNEVVSMGSCLGTVPESGTQTRLELFQWNQSFYF